MKYVACIGPALMLTEKYGVDFQVVCYDTIVIIKINGNGFEIGFQSTSVVFQTLSDMEQFLEIDDYLINGHMCIEFFEYLKPYQRNKKFNKI